MTIRDTGDGIEPEQLPQLFEMFTRGERSARRNQSGLGIGLALVRRLAEMHGGRVEAASEGLGKGSRFSVRLPLRGEVRRGQGAGAASIRASRAWSVLVVDDNRDAAESLACCSQAGAEVRVAHDGPAALAAFERCGPRIVLLDIGMPGWTATRWRAACARSRVRERVALVALTGWGQDEDRRRVREAGFDHHLVKPVDLRRCRRC